MARWLVAKLHDAFPEIRVRHLDAVCLEVGVQVALLGQHRLRFHQPGEAPIRENAVHDRVVLRTVARPVDLNAVGAGVALEFLQVVGDP